MEDKYRILFSPPAFKATLDLVRNAVKRGPRKGGATQDTIAALKEGLNVLMTAAPVQVGLRGEGQRGQSGDDGRGQVNDPATDGRLMGNRDNTELPQG